MPDVKTFNIDNVEIAVKDETARNTATSALNRANQAYSKAEEVEQLARLEISYNSATETITFTRVTNEGE